MVHGGVGIDCYSAQLSSGSLLIFSLHIVGIKEGRYFCAADAVTILSCAATTKVVPM